MIIPKAAPFRKVKIGINKIVERRVLQDIKKDAQQTQAGSRSRLQNPTQKDATSYTTAQDGKQRSCQRPIFFKVNLEYGIEFLSKVMKTRAGDVLGFLIKNIRYGNTIYISPKTISLETGIHLTNVSRYLKELVTKGYIVRDKSDSGADIFMISPVIGVVGDQESEEAIKKEWERLRFKCMKKSARKIKLKSSGGRSETEAEDTRPHKVKHGEDNQTLHNGLTENIH